MTYEQLVECKRVYISYLKIKTEEQDWHAVADIAMDLRELEVRLAQARKIEFEEFYKERGNDK